MAIRPFVENDIPQVVGLYWNHMRRQPGAAPADLPAFFRELYFANPLLDGASPSFVYEDSGKILGFLGTTCRKMSFSGQPIRVGFAGNLVVHPKARSGVATQPLFNAFMAGNHDLLMTDSANDISRRVMGRLGFQTIPALNLHWVRALRPSRYALHLLRRGIRPALQVVTRPLCAVADSVAGRLGVGFLPAKSGLHAEELDVETLLPCLAGDHAGYSLWPEYDAGLLRWLLSFMERRKKRGDLRRIVLRDESRRIVGWYLYYVKLGGVGEVVQVGGEPQFSKAVLGHLFYDAWERGVIALHGVVDFRRMADWSDAGCMFTCRGGWVLAYMKRPDFTEMLERGYGRLSRLDGEWCLDPG